MASDEQGRNHGTIRGGTSLDETGAVAGNAAMGLDGFTGFIDLGDPPSLHPNAFTIEAWIRPASITTDSRVIYRSRYYGVTVQLREGNVIQGTVSGGNSSFQLDYNVAGGPVIDGWHHVVMTKGDGTLRLYLNGVLVDATPMFADTFYSPGGIAIGRDGDHAGGYFEGWIDEVAVYGHGLTPDRVTAHFMSRS